jgi:SAM-dependent methyltransferase
MAHSAQIEFCMNVKELFPMFFKNKTVLDIGSQDINGNNKMYFENPKYIGVDISPGKNVDVVCAGHEYDSDIRFDVVCSTECFEHDPFWDKTLNNMYRLLKPGGLFFFSCAGDGRDEHGTRRTCPSDEDWVQHEWEDYYMNLNENLIREKCWAVENMFSHHQFAYNEGAKDLYFFGIKMPDNS